MGVTRAERERRLEVVEKAIQEHGWSMALERVLAERIGCTRRTIRTYRTKVAELVREELDQDRRLLRASLVVRLRGHQMEARRTGKLGPLSSMLNLEARMTGVLEPEPAPIPDTLEESSLEDLLEELRRDLSPEELDQLTGGRE